MVTAATIIIPQKQQPQLIEVIGGNGRIGSQFMRLLRRDISSRQPPPIAVPRGVCPGSISSSTTATTPISCSNYNPIFVCTPSNTWSTIYDTTTPSSRCSDLVFIGNGLLPHNIQLQSHPRIDTDNADIDTANNDSLTDKTTSSSVKATAATTIVIPHYGILHVGDRPTTTSIGETSISPPPPSPPTYIAGKHSHMVQRLLELDGITNIQRYDTITVDVIKYMIQKVIWTSCLWLLCHTMNDNSIISNNQPLTLTAPQPPLTVSQVHIQHTAILYSLVEELWPSIQSVYEKEVNRWIKHNPTISTIGSSTIVPSITITDVMQYMERYSFSIPNAIPSKVLAMQEIESRNKVFTDCCHSLQQQQPIHYRLLQQVFSNTESPNHHILWKELVVPRSMQPSPTNALPSETKMVDLRSMIGMAVYGHRRPTIQDTVPTAVANDRKVDMDILQSVSQKKNIVIVGAGILGSSVAFNLARLRHEYESNGTPEITITVIDAQCMDISDTNSTTKASFGWINANFMKQPLSYQTLNVLGIHAWYHDPVLKLLPRWNGSIVRKRRTASSNILNIDTSGYYNQSIGPLSDSDLYTLEPNATFTADENVTSDVYYFPNEGFVDPCDAVRTMRNEAKRLDVSFLWNCTVKGIVTTSTVLDTTEPQMIHRYTIEYQNNDGIPQISSTIDADVVVIAAGIGSTSQALGGLPMQQTNCSGSMIHFVKGKKYTACEVKASAQVQKESASLQRVVVDMVNETHVLQRQNGTIIVGGGSPLHVGGTHVAGTTTTKDGVKNEPLSTLSVKPAKSGHLKVAKRVQNLIPNLLDTMIVDKVQTAERSIPFDGLPSIGYYHSETMLKNEHCMQQEGRTSMTNFGGIYSLVSHSGITLAPLLGGLAAAEILDPNLSLDILTPYRPERLFA